MAVEIWIELGAAGTKIERGIVVGNVRGLGRGRQIEKGETKDVYEIGGVKIWTEVEIGNGTGKETDIGRRKGERGKRMTGTENVIETEGAGLKEEVAAR